MYPLLTLACAFFFSRAAELLDSLPDPDDEDIPDQDRATVDPTPSVILSVNKDEEEAALEARETNKYLLAKSFFDCREYDRCAAVFLPESLLGGIIDITKQQQSKKSSRPTDTGTTGLSDEPRTSSTTSGQIPLPKISQRSLFLALYAKFMAGEKRKGEDTEMVLGAQDLGNVTNKNLLVVGRYLERWFSEPEAELKTQGWLEYL